MIDILIDKKLSYRRDNAGRRLLRRSKSFKVTDFGTNRKPISLCDFLVNNTNLHLISHPLPDIAQCWSNYRFWQGDTHSLSLSDEFAFRNLCEYRHHVLLKTWFMDFIFCRRPCESILLPYRMRVLHRCDAQCSTKRRTVPIICCLIRHTIIAVRCREGGSYTGLLNKTIKTKDYGGFQCTWQPDYTSVKIKLQATDTLKEFARVRLVGFRTFYPRRFPSDTSPGCDVLNWECLFTQQTWQTAIGNPNQLNWKQLQKIQPNTRSSIQLRYALGPIIHLRNQITLYNTLQFQYI